MVTATRGTFIAVYAAGFFSLSILQMVALALPLWGGHLGLTASILGLVVASRALSPMIYSIHIGGVMDAVGVRRIMLFFAAQCTVLPIVHPLLPFASGLVILQLLLGLASTMAWLAAQTAIARIAAGNARYTGRFSFATFTGMMLGPVALGLTWDGGGPWAGYGMISLWGLALLIVGFLLPADGPNHRRLAWRDMIPAPAAYLNAWAILRKPIGLFVISCTLLRLAGIGIQESFYPVMLKEFGYGSTSIGILFSLGNLASIPAALMVGWWTRIAGSSRRALLYSVAIAVAAISATPVLPSFWMLICATAIYGFGLGVSLPLIFSLLSRDVEANEQGVAAGLRATANRLGGFITPVLMGVIAETMGIAAAFWAIGAILLGSLFAVGYFSRKQPWSSDC